MSEQETPVIGHETIPFPTYTKEQEEHGQILNLAQAIYVSMLSTWDQDKGYRPAFEEAVQAAEIWKESAVYYWETGLFIKP